MSILIFYGNKDELTMIADTRATYRSSNDAIAYSDNAQKIFRINNTLIGFTGNTNYFTLALNAVKDDSPASYEEIVAAFDNQLRSLSFFVSSPFCTVVIAGINADNEIAIWIMETEKFNSSTITLSDKAYYSNVSCRKMEEETRQKIRSIVNNTPSKNIPTMLEALVRDKHYNEPDNSINTICTIETIRL